MKSMGLLDRVRTAHVNKDLKDPSLHYTVGDNPTPLLIAKAKLTLVLDRSSVEGLILISLKYIGALLLTSKESLSGS